MTRHLTTILRLLLSIIFLSSAILKLWDVDKFVRVIESFDLLPATILRPVAFGIIFLEAICSVCLLANVFVSHLSLLLIGLLTIFLAIALPHLPFISGEPPIECGCFGDFVNSRIDLFFVARNVALLLGCSVLYFFSRTLSPTNKNNLAEVPDGNNV